jgi:hypothetical protein
MQMGSRRDQDRLKDGTWYDADRARWRRVWQVQIREYLIAAIQNIAVLLRYGEEPKKSLLVKVSQAERVIEGVIQPISGMIKDLIAIETNRMMSLDLVRVGFNEIQKRRLFKRDVWATARKERFAPLSVLQG